MRGSALQDALEYVDLEENFAIQQSRKRESNALVVVWLARQWLHPVVCPFWLHWACMTIVHSWLFLIVLLPQQQDKAPRSLLFWIRRRLITFVSGWMYKLSYYQSWSLILSSTPLQLHNCSAMADRIWDQDYPAMLILCRLYVSALHALFMSLCSHFAGPYEALCWADKISCLGVWRSSALWAAFETDGNLCTKQAWGGWLMWPCDVRDATLILSPGSAICCNVVLQVRVPTVYYCVMQWHGYSSVVCSLYKVCVQPLSVGRGRPVFMWGRCARFNWTWSHLHMHTRTHTCARTHHIALLRIIIMYSSVHVAILYVSYTHHLTLTTSSHTTHVAVTPNADEHHPKLSWETTSNALQDSLPGQYCWDQTCKWSSPMATNAVCNLVQGKSVCAHYLCSSLHRSTCYTAQVTFLYSMSVDQLVPCPPSIHTGSGDHHPSFTPTTRQQGFQWCLGGRV